MTNRKLPTIAAVVLVLSSLFAATAVPAMAADVSTQDRNADLAVRQPEYVDSDVRQESANGTPVYVVKGGEILLQPQNFDDGQVIDYGVKTDGGDLTYDSEMGVYVFTPGENASGTYDVYWRTSTTEQVTVEENGTTRNETQTIQHEYSAKIRVEGQTNMVHLSPAESAERQHYLELGREVNGTVQQLRDKSLPFAQNDGSDYEVFQGMTDRYVETGNPVSLFTGNLGAIVTLIVFTLSGWLLVVVFGGGVANVIRQLKKKLHIHESVEAEEGEIADRQAQLDKEERERGMQNVDWNAWFMDDVVADAFRDMGENTHDGIQTLTSGPLHPRVWMRDRLQAMGQCGYQVDVTERDGEIVDAELASPDADDDSLEPVSAYDVDDLVDTIDWEDDEWWQFRLPEADYDPSELDSEPVTMDLDELLYELDLQMEKFPNKRAAGRSLREYIEAVEEHEYTDANGQPQFVREILNNFLKTIQQAQDRHRMPMRAVGEAVERALIDHDPNQEAITKAKEVRAGAD